MQEDNMRAQRVHNILFSSQDLRHWYRSVAADITYCGNLSCQGVNEKYADVSNGVDRTSERKKDGQKFTPGTCAVAYDPP